MAALTVAATATFESAAMVEMQPDAAASPGAGQAGQSPALPTAKGPVEVPELTTEDKIVHRQPDGAMLATLNVEPVRVGQGDRWVPVDTP